MSELTLFLIRVAYLAILWIFVLSAISVIRSDMFGARVPEAARGADAARKEKRGSKRQPPKRRGSPTHVLVTEGSNVGARAELEHAPILIGRGSDAGIKLDDDYVSTRHARIAASGDQWFVEDLGSTNGTYIGTVRITQPTTITLGTQVRIGKTILELEEMRLDFSAISDVGRVRKDNQDSGYVSPHVVAVCDGVGGAARGDIASSTAIAQLRKLEETPPGPDTTESDLLGLVNEALQRAHERIAELVQENPSLNGTSTTATVALFDGQRVGMGHVGDSRAYLFRDGELSQLTNDHTFVQTLIDEGRITEAEARVHPHKNLILRAVDGTNDLEPDLFVLELKLADRLMLCSDGTGVLEPGRLADILASGSPDYAAVELVRASFDAGSSDNVTCLVADVVEGTPDDPGHTPLLVGAAADMRARRTRSTKAGSLFRGHRAGDTGELEPIRAEIPAEAGSATRNDPAVDPESLRYAPIAPGRYAWLSRLLVLAVVVGLLWVFGAGAWSWSQDQYFVGEDDGTVVIYRGIDGSLPGVDLARPHETTNVTLDRLCDFDAKRVREGIDVDSLAEAHEAVGKLAGEMTADPEADC